MHIKRKKERMQGFDKLQRQKLCRGAIPLRELTSGKRRVTKYIGGLRKWYDMCPGTILWASELFAAAHTVGTMA